MKKLIAVLLALLLLTLCFVACGGDKKQNDEDKEQTGTGDTGEDTPNGGEGSQSGEGSQGDEGSQGGDETDEGKLTVGEDTDGGNYGEFIPYN